MILRTASKFQDNLLQPKGQNKNGVCSVEQQLFRGKHKTVNEWSWGLAEKLVQKNKPEESRRNKIIKVRVESNEVDNITQ